jgi:hypothetical protein
MLTKIGTMNRTFAAVLAAACALSAGAAEFSILVVDGLGRPLKDVSVEVCRLRRDASNDVTRLSLAKATSDTNGLARGTYDEKIFGTNDTLSVELSKTGYAGYAAGPQADYVLCRQFVAEDVGRIAKLAGETQKSELRELLAGEFDSTTKSLNELVFVNGSRLRPPLRSLVDDLRVGLKAGELLAFIGLPDDMRLLVQNAPTPRRDPGANRWAHRVVAALIEPPSEREWAYLKRCAQDEFRDHFVDAAAIRTLRLNGTARAAQVLKDVRRPNAFRTNEIDEAIAYINSSPPPLEDRDLTTAAIKVATALKLPGLWSNQPPQFNEERDMALVDYEFVTGRQMMVYTATFQRVAEVWKLRGVRETRQAALPHATAGTSGAEKK